MNGWKRTTYSPTRLGRRKPVVLNLEILESRELLDAGFAGQGASALRTDLARLGNDLATAPITLLNALQPSSTNTPTVASVVNQWNKESNLLVQDWQAVLKDEYDALSRSSFVQAIEQADNRFVQIVDAAFGLLDSLFVKPGVGAGSPTAPAATTPTETNPTLGSTGQAPGSGITGGGSPIAFPLARSRLPGIYVGDDSNLCNCGCTNEAGSLMQNTGPDIRMLPPPPPRFAPADIRMLPPHPPDSSQQRAPPTLSVTPTASSLSPRPTCTPTVSASLGDKHALGATVPVTPPTAITATAGSIPIRRI
jgi:hypothetical protein